MKNKRIIRTEIVESLYSKDISKISAKQLIKIKTFIENIDKKGAPTYPINK